MGKENAFHTFFCAFILFDLAVFTYDHISGKLEHRLVLCPKLPAEFFYRQVTYAYQLIGAVGVPPNIAILELIVDSLLRHSLETPQ